MTTATLTLPDETIDQLADLLSERVTYKKAYTTEDLATYLGVTPRYVRGMGDRGCPNHRVGKRAIWLLDEVLAWVAER